MSALDDALAELFAVPVDEFLEKREELVGRLRSAGDKQAAMAVKARGKPTLAAHALNQVPRVAAAELDELLEAGRALASGKDFQENLERQRKALEALRRKIDGPHVTELVSVLRGAMVDSELALLVRAGQFSKVPEVQAGFFGAAPQGGPKLQLVQGGKDTPVVAKKTAAAEPVKPRLKTKAEHHADEASARKTEKLEKQARERAERKARELAEAEKELKKLNAAADDAERVAATARRAAKVAADRVKAMRERD